MPATFGSLGSSVNVVAAGCVPREPISILVISVPAPSSALFQSTVKVTEPVLTNLKPLLPPASSASNLLLPFLHHR